MDITFLVQLDKEHSPQSHRWESLALYLSSLFLKMFPFKQYCTIQNITNFSVLFHDSLNSKNMFQIQGRKRNF